jgi:hypothetical protein
MGLPCHWPRRARHSRVGGRGTALDRGRHPETPGKGAPNWGTRGRDILDVRCETPERQRHLAGGVDFRDRSEPGGAERGTVEARAPPRSGAPTGGDPNWACDVPRRGGERESPHYGPRQNPHPSIVVSSNKRDSAPGVLWSRVRISWDHRRPLRRLMQRPLNPRPLAVSGRQRSCSPRARPKRRSISLLNWNVGLDYTARRPNCQSANAFVEPRQTRAPRLRNAPSKTDPRVPSQPLASRASSRPRSAPSTIA